MRDGLSCICEKRENGNVGLIQSSNNDITLDMAVNVNPCHSLVPMSIVALSNIVPCDLCIFKSHAIRRASYQCEPIVMGEWVHMLDLKGPMVSLYISGSQPP